MVYKALDEKLDRHVALKFLPVQVGLNKEDKERFIQEARMTSALDHPNICTIFDIDETPDGQLFIVMACYDGETLQDKTAGGPLSVKEAVEIITQVAEGLGKAHDNGVIHRDIKPANLMITMDGVLKLLDFGIAKLKNAPTRTAPGMIVGTPAYMSPEQIRGETVDHRSDIWSAGVILYQMLTGRLPFAGESTVALMYSIVNETAEPVGRVRRNVPPALQSVVEKMMAKEPADRYQDAHALVNDLKNLHSENTDAEKTRVVASLPETPSIAVLRFADLSPEKDQEYFCDGLTEEIIQALSRLNGLKVASRNSVFRFKQQHPDIGAIGRELQVQNVLEGSVRKAGEMVRISIRLNKVADGFLLWAENFDRQLTDIFAVQDEIAQSVVRNMEVKLGDMPETRLVKPVTDQMEAYQAYLRGRFHWNRRTGENLEKSIGYFQSAINIDPGYALAYAGLADAFAVLGLYSARPPQEVMPRARSAAEQALQLNENLAEAHISLGLIRAVFEWDWDAAEREFRRGVALNPRYALGHHWFAINYLVPLAQFEAAGSEIVQALRLDPVSLVINTTVGLVYYYSREYDTAVNYFHKALEMDPNFAMSNFFLGKTYIEKTMFDEAIDYLQKSLQLFGESNNMLATYAYAAAAAGKGELARNILQKLLNHAEKGYVSAYDIACVYAGLDQPQPALEWLGKACEERSYLLIYLRVDPMLDRLRGLEKFGEIEQKIFPHM